MSEQSLWFIPSLDWLRSPSLDDDAPYLEAVAWAQDFTPEPDKDSYGVAYEHAKRKYDQSVAHFDLLDKKADDLMKSAVAVSALMAGAIKALDVVITPWLICAFLSFLGTIVVAAISRRPTLQATPGGVDEILDFIEDFRIHDRHQVEALVAASLRCAVVGTQVAIRWKGDQVSRATILFVMGIVLLMSLFG